MRIAEAVRQKVIEIDRRYRSSWDTRSIAFAVGISATSVAKILKAERGPRPKPGKRSHERRTRFLLRDVMWSSDYKNLLGGRKLLKTMDEMSRYRVGWEVRRTESAEAVVAHAEDLIRRMGRSPLAWKYDHGSPFTSDLFQDFLARHRIIPYPIPPRAPWANGRNERDNQEIANWLLALEGKELDDAELERDVDEGMLMLNYVKPRAVLGFRRSAEVYFGAEGVEGIDREHVAMNLLDIECQMGAAHQYDERIHRRAVRKLMQEWKLYEEWEVARKGVGSVNRTGGSDVAI